MILKLPGRQLELKKGLAAAAAAVLLLLGCLIGYIVFREDSDIIVESSAAALAPASSSDGTETAVRRQEQEAVSVSGTAIKTSQIKVYVTGCVNKPGIVTLEKGQLIDDAIRMAGGLTKDADSDAINMVYVLNENTMLRIKPEEPPNKEQPSASSLAKASGKAKKEGKNIANASNTAGTGIAGAEAVSGGAAGEGAVITGGCGTGVEMMNASGKADEPAGTSPKSSAVNINTAGASELDTLPGIGQATARDIIAFREKNGPFKKIEDIMQVPRIKQNRFDNIKESICVN